MCFLHWRSLSPLPSVWLSCLLTFHAYSKHIYTSPQLALFLHSNKTARLKGSSALVHESNPQPFQEELLSLRTRTSCLNLRSREFPYLSAPLPLSWPRCWSSVASTRRYAFSKKNVYGHLTHWLYFLAEYESNNFYRSAHANYAVDFFSP